MHWQQNLPLFAALLISIGFHMAFMLRAPAEINTAQFNAAPSLAIKLAVNTPPKTPSIPLKNIEKEVLTTISQQAATTIAPKREPEPEPELAIPEKPEVETKPAMVTREAKFSQAPTPPVYPERSRRERQEGVVMVRAQVDAHGKTLAVQLAQSSGFPLLDKAALDAVAKWAFIAAEQNGQAITAWIEVPINFKLR